MITPLLSTKLYVPYRQPLSQQDIFVPRPRLLERLNAGLAGKLILIAAPAGFGKSTLLVDWIGGPEPSQAANRPAFCWLTLDKNDNDPVRFWLYLLAALHSVNPGLSANTPALLQSPEPPPLETILTILLNDLDAWSSQSESQIVLILEDYHLITTPGIHQSLTFLLDHLPPTLHLVMTTRADPPLPLARLRAQSLLSEIRADDLRFSAAETAAFLNDRIGLNLATDEVQLLAMRTEGWIAGLQLAALSMHGRADKGDFIRSFSGSHRYILNYLIEEVLNQQPQIIQTFLLHTSILTRLSGPLCDAVVGVIERENGTSPAHTASLNSQFLLEQLHQTNLFLIPLDDLDEWYRYHQLFAEVLQHRLRQHQPEMLTTLHRRATLWYSQQGYLADAIHHALMANDPPLAADLIEQAWPALWNQGAIATLFNWMEALSAETSSDSALQSRPSLYISYAWGLVLAGRIEAAETALQQVEAALRRAGMEVSTSTYRNTLLGRAAALRSILAARRGDPAGAVGLAQQAVDLIPGDAPARGDAYYALGLAKQLEGSFDEALVAYDAATRAGTAANDSFLTVAPRYHVARILMIQGKLHEAAASYQQVLAVAAGAEKQLPVIGLVHVGYGEVLYQWNDLVAAAHQLDVGLALSPARDLTYTDGSFHRFSLLARNRRAMGDGEGALLAVGMAQHAAQQTGIALDVERAAALEALIQLRLRASSFAARWAERYEHAQTPPSTLSYLHEFEELVFIRALLAQNRVEEALTLTAQWLPLVEASQRHGTTLELYLLRGLTLYAARQSDEAMAIMAEALALAEPERYIRLFIDEGEPMRAVLRALSVWLDHQPSDDARTKLLAFTSTLLNAFDDRQSQRSEPADAVIAKILLPRASFTPLVEPLTMREIDVLTLLAAGLSNAAIADELVVSVGTVKTHLKHIYGKLAVGSRTQAVAKAHALDLL